MRRLIVGFCIATVALLALLYNPTPAPSEDEKYAVYSVVIREKYLREGVQRIVIDENTEACQSCAARRGLRDEIREIKEGFELWGIRADTVANYFGENSAPHRLQNRFALPVPVTVLSKEESENLFVSKRGGDPWQDFYEKYPNSPGILTFSQVGFNAARDQALVYTSYTCGRLCGVGEYYFLVKTDGVWRLEMARLLWVS